jgi:hypothetical protein
LGQVAKVNFWISAVFYLKLLFYRSALSALHSLCLATTDHWKEEKLYAIIMALLTFNPDIRADYITSTLLSTAYNPSPDGILPGYSIWFMCPTRSGEQSITHKCCKTTVRPSALGETMPNKTSRGGMMSLKKLLLSCTQGSIRPVTAHPQWDAAAQGV